MKNLASVKETKKSFIVNIDDYCSRERYYQGSKCGVVLRIEKTKYTKKQLIEDQYNDWFDNMLDVIIAHLNDNVILDGVHFYRKGHIIN